LVHRILIIKACSSQGDSVVAAHRNTSGESLLSKTYM
jgi:hypothetical protein